MTYADIRNQARKAESLSELKAAEYDFDLQSKRAELTRQFLQRRKEELGGSCTLQKW